VVDLLDFTKLRFFIHYPTPGVLYAATAFFPNEENFIVATMFVAGTAPFVCIPSIAIWALFGSSIKLIIQNTKIKKIIEYLLALLLVATAVIIVFD